MSCSDVILTMFSSVVAQLPKSFVLLESNLLQKICKTSQCSDIKDHILLTIFYSRAFYFCDIS